MKGVSPVVATVLMVAIAIAAAVIAYSWMMSMQATIQGEASRGAGAIGKDRISVEAATCYDPDNNAATNNDQLRVYVRNLGTEDLNGIFSVVVKSQDTGTVEGVDSDVSPASAIAPGATGSLDTNILCANLSSYILVEVRTPNGSIGTRAERIR